MRLPRSLLVCVCLALVACGNARTKPSDVSLAAPPIGSTLEAYPSAGVTLHAPTDWLAAPGSPPRVATVSSGLASIAVWRYPRSARLPRSKVALLAAARRLVALVRTRDATFTLGSVAVVGVAHRGAIQVRGLETIDGQRREVRSTHLYVHGAEIVVDAFAPPSQFRAVDRFVFHPLLRGLRIGKPLP